MKFRLSIPASALILALSACGGGGGSAGPAAAPAQPVVPATVATPVPTSAPVTAPQSTAQVTLTIPSAQTSAHGRSAHFVSANATLFKSTVLSVNGSATLPNGTPAIMTTAISPNGHDGTCGMFFPIAMLVCVVTVQAPTGYEIIHRIASGTLRRVRVRARFVVRHRNERDRLRHHRR